MPPTIAELEKVKKRLKDNKEEQQHLDKVIQEMHDEGWNDLSPSERAFVYMIEDKCKECSKTLDDCDCKKDLPSYAHTDFAKTIFGDDADFAKTIFNSNPVIFGVDFAGELIPSPQGSTALAKRELTPLGLYSNIEEAVKKWAPKGTPHELRKHLAKTAGTGYSDKLEYEMEPHPQFGQVDPTTNKPFPKERAKTRKPWDLSAREAMRINQKLGESSTETYWKAIHNKTGQHKDFFNENEANTFMSAQLTEKVPLPWKELQGSSPKEKTWLVPGNQADLLKMEDLLKNKKHVTKEEVLAHIKKHDVPFSEVDQNKMLNQGVDVSDLEKKMEELHGTPDEELEPIEGKGKYRVTRVYGDNNDEEALDDEDEAQRRADILNDEHYSNWLDKLKEEWAPEEIEEEDDGEPIWTVSTRMMPLNTRLAWEARHPNGGRFKSERDAQFALSHFLQHGNHELRDEEEANPWLVNEDEEAHESVTDPTQIRARRIKEIEDEITERRQEATRNPHAGPQYKEYSMPNENGVVPSTYNEFHVTAPPREEKTPTMEEVLNQMEDKITDKDPSHYRFLFPPQPGTRPAIEHIETGDTFTSTGLDHLDKKEPTWKDQHGNYSHVENPMTRLRYDIRQDSEGKKNFFMQEIQSPSDYIQKGMPAHVSKRLYQTGLKTALVKAVNSGADKFSWTTGDQQRERYNLRSKVDKLEWSPYPGNPEGGTLMAYKNGKAVGSAQRIDGKENTLSEAVGSEIAKELQSQERKPRVESRQIEGYESDDNHGLWNYRTNEWMPGRGTKENMDRVAEAMNTQERLPATIEGKKLDIGGMGHKRNYDKMIPDMLRDIVTKGAKSNGIALSKEQLYEAMKSKTMFPIKANDIQVERDFNADKFKDTHEVYVKYQDLHRRLIKDELSPTDAANLVEDIKKNGHRVNEQVHTLVLTPEIKAAIAGGLASFSKEEVDFDQRSTDKRISSLKKEFAGLDTATELRRDLIRELRISSEQALIEVFGSHAPRDAKTIVREFLSSQRAYAYNYAAEAKDNGVLASRTQMYASALHGLYQSLKRLKAEKGGANWERRVLGPAEQSCSTCTKLAKRSWAKIGTLPKIGDSPCKANCRCRFEFSVQDKKPSIR